MKLIHKIFLTAGALALFSAPTFAGSTTLNWNGYSVPVEIPDDIYSLVVSHQSEIESALESNNVSKAEVEEAFKDTEPTMQLTLESTDLPATILPHEQAFRLIDALCECPHGVIAMENWACMTWYPTHSLPILVLAHSSLVPI